jgi:very-short-patch-repair endonuclease
VDERLDRLYAQGNLVERSPELASVIDRALRLKQIEAVLPGIYARTHHKTFPEVRVDALQLYEPKAILVEQAAARLSFWPEVEVDDVAAVVPRKLAARAGYRFLRRTVPASLVQEIDGVRMTVPALTAVDLGADAIDHALRTGAATLEEMREALAAIRWQPGNGARRLVLQESSDEPWSTAERRFHRLLRAAGIGGWRGNVKASGTTHTVDILFSADRLVVEIDGHHYHGDANFEFDRWRQNDIVLAGWRVLRFTWTMIDKYPERVVETVHAALAQRRGSTTTTGS